MTSRHCLFVFVAAFASTLTTHAALTLGCEIDGRMLPIAAVESGQVLLDDAGRRIAVPEKAAWKLDGDLRANAGIVRWSPIYRIRSELDADGRVEGARQRIGQVTLVHWASANRDDAPETVFLLDDWPDGVANEGALVFAWMLNGRATQVIVRPISATATTPAFTEIAEFKLSEAETAGQPVMLLWADGKFLPVHPMFSEHAGNDAVLACLFNDPSALRDALRRGFKPDTVGQSGATLLHFAAEAGAVDAIDVLLAAEPRLLDVSTEGGSSPLLWAAADGRIASVKRLLDAGATVDPPENPARTALHEAIEAGHSDVVHLLLAARGGMSVVGRDRVPLLIVAIAGGYADIVEQLWLGGNATAAFFDKPAPSLHGMARRGHTSMVEWFLARGTDANIEFRGITALHAAARHGPAALARTLIAAGADPGRPDPAGTTPLMIAAAADNRAFAAALLDGGASVEARDHDGRDALHFAARANSPDMIELLLQHGASRDAVDAENISPFGAALFAHARRAATALFAHGARIAPDAANAEAQLAAAIRMDAAEIVDATVSDGWPLERIVAGGMNALRLAETVKAAACVSVLQKAGAKSEPARGPALLALRDLDAAPTILSAVAPVDPRDPSEKYGAADVRVEFFIDARGQVFAPRILEMADASLGPALLDALTHWRFAPPTSLARPVATRMETTVRFPDAEARVFESWQVDAPAKMTAHPPALLVGENARDTGHAARCRLTIGARGRVEACDVLETRGLDPKATPMDAVRQIEFTPAVRDGKPVSVLMQLEVFFDRAGP